MAYLMTTGKTREEAISLVRNAHEPAWTSGDIETLDRTLVFGRNNCQALYRFPDGREAVSFGTFGLGSTGPDGEKYVPRYAITKYALLNLVNGHNSHNSRPSTASAPRSET